MQKPICRLSSRKVPSRSKQSLFSAFLLISHTYPAEFLFMINDYARLYLSEIGAHRIVNQITFICYCAGLWKNISITDRLTASSFYYEEQIHAWWNKSIWILSDHLSAIILYIRWRCPSLIVTVTLLGFVFSHTVDERCWYEIKAVMSNKYVHLDVEVLESWYRNMMRSEWFVLVLNEMRFIL